MTKSKSDNIHFCNLYSLIKQTNNTKLLDLIDNLCLENSFKSRKDVTFLYPSDTLVESLLQTFDNDPNKCRVDLKNLLIRGKYDVLNGGEELTTFNGTYINDLQPLKLLNYSHFDDNIKVFGKIESIPKTKEKDGKGIIKKKRGRGIDTSENNPKIKFTNDLNTQAMQASSKFKFIFGYKLNSLLSYLKSKHNDIFNIVKEKIDPNLWLSWYIIVQPNNTKPTYIPNEVFSNWVSNKTDSDSLDVIQQIFNTNDNTTQNKISVQSGLRKSVTKENDDLNCTNFMKRVLDSYPNKLNALEDELRFKFKDMNSLTNEDTLELYLIDWELPEKSLTMLNFDNLNNELYNIEKCRIINDFIHSNYFHYFIYDTEIIKKINNAISGGSENFSFIMGGYEDIKAIADHDNEEPLKKLKSQIRNLNPSDLEELNKFINEIKKHE